jgi:hypothetical protein
LDSRGPPTRFRESHLFLISLPVLAGLLLAPLPLDAQSVRDIIDRVDRGGNWSLGADVSLRGGFFLGFGDGTVDPSIGLASEFGTQPNVGYVSLSHFF